MSCTALEPAPTRFYAPLGMFSAQDLQQLSAEWLGDTIVSPAGSFRYRVVSGPLRLAVLGQQQSRAGYD